VANDATTKTTHRRDPRSIGVLLCPSLGRHYGTSWRPTM
jgi:hypothetical protein